MKTVGILGGGQLAQLLAIAAYQLGLNTLCFVESEDCPAKRVSPLFLGNLDNQNDLIQFAQKTDVITLENENIPDIVLETLKRYTAVLPGQKALHHSQDRLIEKQLFNKLNIPTVPFKPINQKADIESVELPAIIKTRRFGYDGKGQFRLAREEQRCYAWQAIDKKPAICESLIEFDCEISQIATRNQKGEIVFYPLIHNHHEHGILRTSTLPADMPSLIDESRAYITLLLKELDYVGTLALEFFVKDQTLLANEMAPRVHNSGHVTIEATNCSQFENHLRAICDLPLIEPKIIQGATMHNIIGKWTSDEILKNAWHVYDYGKTERENRKLGHWVK